MSPVTLCLTLLVLSASTAEVVDRVGNLQGDEFLLRVLKKIERKIEEQNAVIAGQQLQIQSLKENVDKLNDEIRLLKATQRSPVQGNSGALTTQGKGPSMMRSCDEIRSADPASSSGMYYIDPDGVGIGHVPIFVFCTMSTGATVISHDSEDPMDIGHCYEPGCYSRDVTYNATIRQMTALTQLSDNCRQFIQFDCYGVPLELNGEAFAWWNDRNGDPQIYWAGSNKSAHTCQCGIDGNCVVPVYNCNCDTSAAFALKDQGYLTDKDVLPVTKLNFGRSLSPESAGSHTLGQLECWGKRTLGAMPKSCVDLWMSGHTLSGIYSVQGDSQVESVYCDFAKMPGEDDFQETIGAIDIKSSPVYFHVHRGTTFSSVGTLTFDTEILNIGNAMDLTSGIFTAPKAGMYFFSFTGTKAHVNVETYFSLHLNNNTIARTIGASIQNYFAMPLSATVKMNPGDQIKLVLGSLNSTPGNPTVMGGFNSFTGVMLEEFISQN